MKNKLLLSFLSCLIIIFSGCGTMDSAFKENLSQVDYLKAKAKLVKYVTSGRINPVSTIQVIFHKDQVPESNVGKVINRNVFQFSPSINGKTTWETRKKLVLTPTIALPAHQSFKGYLDMMLLFGTNKKKIKRIKLKFSTGGQKILSFDHEFVPDSNSQPLRVRLKGNFHFLNQEKIESLQKIIKLYEGSQQLKIKFYKKDSKNFYFTTNPFTRSHKQRVFDLYVPSTALHIKKAIRKKIYLYSISSLRIASITPLVQKKANRIKIAFSSKLDLSKNYNGFIQVRHKRKNGTYKTVKFKMKTQKEALILTGNFLPGHEYKVSILNGITAKNATKLKKAYTRSVHFLDIKSKIVFQHDGIFLPSSNRRKIYFSTINLSKVRLEVKQVFDQNLGFFLQESRLSSKKGRTDLYNYELNRVGITIHKEILKIGKIKNKWLKSELDLSKIFNKHKSGLFVIILKFRKKDALVDKKLLDWSHMSRHKRILKPVILSDLGLIAKRGNSETTVFVTNLIDTKPVSGVIVKAYSYQNQLLDSKITDQSGICDLKTTKAYYIEASYNKHKAILKFSEMELNKSLFNTGGSSAGKSGIRCFSYTERGVYRPGDNINLSLIVRNNNGSFPENHPVSLKFYNPRNRKVSEIINKKSIDGFYNFNLKTLPDALTGNWEARIQIGDRKFYQTVKIETVVPFKLKVNIYPDKKILLPDDHKISFKVESKYLFGTPASGNNTSSKITIKSIAPVFQNYKTYSFFNEARAFTPVTSPKFEAILSSKGQTNVSWNIPEFKNVPGILKTTIESIVFEKGGRQVLKTRTIPYNFYSLYVGVLKPETLNIKTGDTVKIPFIAVNHDGKPVKGKKLTYRIYKNNHYWWWDYSNQVNFRKHFKSNVDTELVKSGSLTTDVIPVTLKITAENSGEMLIEVQNGEDGHCSSFFFSSHSWGSENRGKDADVIQIKTDSKKYTPGSVATATIKSPSVGMILISIEKAGKILNTKWKAVNKGETKLEIPVTKNMIPTAYLSVMLIQPHAQSKNDRPLRMYGIVPLNVEEKSTHLTFNLETPKSTLPESEFDIRIKTSDGKKAQFTIAIVDEGLLDLTGFRTPAPWKFFFQKESLLIRTFDIFSDVIGANWGEIYKVFSIGGGGWEEDERKRQSPVKVKRFKPVALFKGPIETNEKGEYKTSFKMPNYIGSVKVMVVGARGNSYGKRDAKVLVKSPIMIMPTLPRSLAPEDEFEIPVTFFSMEKNVGKVKIDIETKGPITVIDKTEYNLYCNSIEEKMVYFKCKAGKEVGKAKIIIKATSTAYTSKSNTEIAVRPVNPFTSITTSEILKKGKTINLKIPGEVIKGSSSAKLTVSKYPQMNFNHRLKWLIKYPYGCIEQTVSSAFPQLYLGDLVKLSTSAKSEIDRNINKTIKRLLVFQTIRGGFSYWPNGSDDSIWGTTYAGHFMVEAKKKGYYVPEDIFNNWLNFQKERSLVQNSNIMARTYRLYVLSLAGVPQAGPMNLLKENHLIKMSNTEKWLLAAAYYFAGNKKTAESIASVAKLDVRNYIEFSNNYGSTLRDRAIILEVLSLLGKFEKGLPVFKEVSTKVASKNWYSTQTLSYALLAMQKYVAASKKSSGPLNATVKYPDGKIEKIDSTDILTSLSMDHMLGKKIEVKNNSAGQIFASIEWEGIPERSFIKTSNRNLNIELNWYDEDGNNITPDKLDQGKTFWGHIRLKKPAERIDEIALVQILPSGWEIENTRLNNTQMPFWMNTYKKIKPEYVDIRDDRVMWFFDAPKYKNTIDFVFKLNTVTAGSFYLSPTVAESMYNDQYKAVIAGKNVSVIRK